MLGFIEVSCRLAGLRGTRLGARSTAASLGQRTICNHTRFRAFLPSAPLVAGRTDTLVCPVRYRRRRADRQECLSYWNLAAGKVTCCCAATRNLLRTKPVGAF